MSSFVEFFAIECHWRILWGSISTWPSCFVLCQSTTKQLCTLASSFHYTFSAQKGSSSGPCFSVDTEGSFYGNNITMIVQMRCLIVKLNPTHLTRLYSINTYISCIYPFHAYLFDTQSTLICPFVVCPTQNNSTLHHFGQLSLDMCDQWKSCHEPHSKCCLWD